MHCSHDADDAFQAVFLLLVRKGTRDPQSRIRRPVAARRCQPNRFETQRSHPPGTDPEAAARNAAQQIGDHDIVQLGHSGVGKIRHLL